MSKEKQIPLNVVIMGNFPYPQGMAGTKRIQHFVDYLLSRQIPVFILLLRQGGQRANKQLSGTHLGADYQTIGHRITSGLAGLFYFPAYLLDGFRLLKKKRCTDFKNVLYMYKGPTIENLPFLLAAKILGYRVVIDIVEELVDFSENRHFAGRIKAQSRRLLDNYLHFLADGLVVISHYLKDRYRLKLGEHFPMVLVPIAARVSVNNAKTEFGSPVKIVYSGSFARKDGVDNLIQAFINKRDKLGDAELYLTGMGNNAEEIRLKVEAEPRIRFLGYLADTEFYQFLLDADILCMNRTDSEFANAGFPFKLGEYLATGNPVIASDIGDVSRYLVDKKDAFLVTANDTAAIEDALEFALNNPPVALQIGKQGQGRCRDYFDPEKNSHLLLAFLTAL